MRVEETKELVKGKLIEQGKADVFYDLSEEVICRCGHKVVIKRIDDQWFIRYSDSELTRKSKEHAAKMNIFPTEYSENISGVLDWFSDRACARLGNWLGSKFPFDKQWTVEPISDSTLYPVYYIVSKFINNGTIEVNELTEEFFDYVFLEKGEGKESWKEIREEFNYFYPLDINLGGKEHKTVHFPVFIMNHVAIFPPGKLPQGIFVNWWVTGKGSKISKSKGGAEPIPAAMEKYGVDAMRLYYAHIGSPHVDVVWTEDVVLNYKNALERISSLVEKVENLDGKPQSIDNWLVSKTYENLKKVNEAMKTYGLRELASIVYFAIYDDFRWYLRRGGENKKTIEEVIQIWCHLMNPLTPHLSEELNKGKELISSSSWPELEEEKIDLRSESGENLVKEVMEGMRNVKKLAKLDKITKAKLFVAEKWLYQVYTTIANEINVTRNVGEMMRKVLEDDSLKPKGKEITKIVTGLLKDVTRIPSLVTSQEEELKVIQDSTKFLEQEFECSIEIILAEESDLPKAKSAMPGKVGILIE